MHLFDGRYYSTIHTLRDFLELDTRPRTEVAKLDLGETSS